MSLDRIALHAYFRAIEPRVVGRRIEKVRPHGTSALRIELSSRDTLFVDVSRGLAGFWLLSRATALPADSRDVEGPSRTAALLFKKHLEGSRIESLTETPARLQSFATARATLHLRPYGNPGASLVREDALSAHFGAGEPVLSSPADACGEPGFEIGEALDFTARVLAASPDERRLIVASRDPGLLPLLRRWPESDDARRRLAATLSQPGAARPFLSPPLADDAANAAAPPALVPFEPDGPCAPGVDFAAAAEEMYKALRRADLFRSVIQSRLARAKAEVARRLRLKAALVRDSARWPDPLELRRQAEALLAAPMSDFQSAPGGAPDVVVVSLPDPRTGNLMQARINPRLSFPRNADALFSRARNIERQRTAFEERWDSVILALDDAERALASCLRIRSLDDLGPLADTGSAASVGAPPRRYLTSRGLEMLFGRNAAQNHDVTFHLAKREDIWFHVLDAPGGHVVLRNRDGRANRDDIAEAASLAAFLSERRTEGQVDVQYTARKHVHPGGGGKGRVRVSHAEVIRVAPKDPAGRLRGRS